MDNLNKFNPDWVSPPGDTIADALEEFGWKRKDFAERTGFSEKHVSQLIGGKAPIPQQTASVLARVIGSTVEFWLRREANYRAGLERLKQQKDLQNWTPWLGKEKFPLKEIMKSGFIPKRRLDEKNKPQIVEDLLCFFGTASPKAWEAHYNSIRVSFRRSIGNTANRSAISVWLRAGEKIIEKQGPPTNPYSKARFRTTIDKIRELTTLRPEDFEMKMKNHCSECGVSLVFVPSIPTARTSGAARWLSPTHPLIQMSLYGKYNDRFWFTFFHEAAHILLHQETKTVFIDNEKGSDETDSKEKQANKFAAQTLIPEEDTNRLELIENPKQLLSFARKINIDPGIVVGRMQHKKIVPFSSSLNKFKSKLKFKDQ